MSSASNDRIIVAIDGFSSCGKSTLAKDLAQSLSYIYIDSGAMYRAIALYFLENKIDLAKKIEVNVALQDIKIAFKNESNGLATYLNGHNVTQKIRDPNVSAIVSEVAAMPEVRLFLREAQMAFGKNKGVVMDGRDIGSVIFPEAELKLYLTASIDVRAQRRYQEIIQDNQEVDFTQVLNNLVKRDKIDSTRSSAPLIKTADAIEIDNSNITREEQLNLVLHLAHSRLKELKKYNQKKQSS